MVQPNSSFDELASITIANYSDDLRDNITNNIPLMKFMDELGAVVEEDGGTTLLENLDFADNTTFIWYSGYQEIPTTPTEAFTSASYDWKEAGCNILFNAREIAINSGKSKRHDLVKGKTKNGERTMRNNIGAALYYSSTENSGLSITGLQAAVADDPSTGIYGGINRATAGNEFWRNQKVDFSDESITISATTIEDAMELGWARVTRGMDTPKLIPFGDTYWRYFAGAVGSKQMYVKDDSKPKTGHVSFPYYMFKTAKVFNDPNCSATRGYMLNTDYLKLKVHSSRNFSVGKSIMVPGQRATVIPVDWMGNLVCGNASLQLVMHA